MQITDDETAILTKDIKEAKSDMWWRFGLILFACFLAYAFFPFLWPALLGVLLVAGNAVFIEWRYLKMLTLYEQRFDALEQTTTENQPIIDGFCSYLHEQENKNPHF